MKDRLAEIRRLVGKITGEELRYVDCFIEKRIGLFMPVGGACFSALTPLHSHPSYMFVLPFNEETSLDVGGKTIKASRGKIFAVSPDIPHHELPSETPPRYIAVFIDKALFEKELSQYPVERTPSFRGESYCAAPNLLPLLKQFMIEADNKMPGSKSVLRALGIEVCNSIIRGIFNFSAVNDRITERVEVDRAVEFMHANLAQKLTVEKMAKIARMSPTHFSRVFKEETGKTPMEYLGRIRLEKVKKLLTAGDRSITEIALECGFNTPSYFSACFRRAYKMAPSAYLKAQKRFYS